MPVQSKISRNGSRAASASLVLAGAAGTLALTSQSPSSFVAPSSTSSTSQAQAPASLAATLPAAAAAAASPTTGAAAAAPAAAGVLAALAGVSSMNRRGGRISKGERARIARMARKMAGDLESGSETAVPPVPTAVPQEEMMELSSYLIKNPRAISDELIFRVRDCALKAMHSSLAAQQEQAKQAFAEVAASAQSALESGKHPAPLGVGALAAMLLAVTVDLQPVSALDQVTYSEFLSQVDQGSVEMVRVQQDMLAAQFTTKEGNRREVNLVPNAAVEDALFDKLAEKKVEVVVQSQPAGPDGPLGFLAQFAGPIAWLIAGLLLLFGGLGGAGAAGGPGGNPFQMTKSPAKVIKEGEVKTKFADVAGCDGAKQELVEVVDFLKNSTRYTELGAKIPKGALLSGPPGTGKTLLAKAVAGEAAVPFFSVSASEFVEVFAGAGAGRVEMFAEAKKAAPCIIFIDEIDAVGRQRSAGFGQGNDEREQTVNQLLTEMDGFDVNNGVVVIAATNRVDTLDRALIRPGRFDRQIQVDPPDVEGRTAILKVHARNKTLAPGVDLAAIARQTPGLAGADLANLLNEGAIVAARKNKSEVDQDDIADALERISIGLEKKDGVMSDKKKKLVAYHEAGHAILGALMNDYDVVTKISIVPRGPAGGVTIFMPSEERLNSGLYSKEFLENRMCVALGGRIAEELINGVENVTTGASNDFQQCTQVAQAMVTQLGMSPLVGQRCIGQQQGGQPFMGRDMMGQGPPPVSQDMREKIDGEVKRIVNEQYARGKTLLESNRYLLDKLADKLIEQEKVNGDELMKLISQVSMEGQLVAAPFMGERTASSGGDDEEEVAAAFMGERRCAAPAQSDAANKTRPITEVEVLPEEPVCEGQQSQQSLSARFMAELRQKTGAAASEQTLRTVASQALAVAIATSALPLPAAWAEEAAVAPATQQTAPAVVQQAEAPVAVATQQSISGRATYSRLLEFNEEGKVRRVEFYNLGRTAVATVEQGGDRLQQLAVDVPGASPGLIEKLQAKGVQIDVKAPEKPNEFLKILGDIAFPLLVIAGLLFLRSQSSGAGPGGMPGMPGMQNRAKIQVSPETGVKFEDVAGIDEAKEELTEIVDFLKAPERFVKVGAKIPKGVLLTGPPGTGKTLMAKALAGESGVPFIQASASEFIELFVGVGASRVRDIFKQAKEKSPCIIFIDEIDAIGRQRGAGMGGGNDEREQTLNQILTEMDGFEGNTGIIVVAATNRADILDNALLRPGRFDRRVTVGLPDVKGREQILGVHVKNKKLAEDLDLKDIATRTVGMSGADLENLMNEAAILAARRELKAITNQEVADATDRVIAGLEGNPMGNTASKKLVAYHEAGHALVGTMLPYHDSVNKLTLIPRGQAKGLTWFSPGEDQSLLSQNQLKARIAGALGGRAAEQIVFGTDQVTTGAGGDLQQVERMARGMVTQFGMSSVGSIAIDDGGFTGPNYSEELASKIDGAIREISDAGYEMALEICTTHRAILDAVAEELCETETMSGKRLREIVEEMGVQVPVKLAAV
eukprot:CAMPEP_0178467164 /NCGR_PEP_ID=MMETSP0689_2-20121128/52274_1 /TAXON_ID=160604 /ORGANISM="Amphidinium massartii, Strain CS-259" /LENGTH=1537 /DNA_ID=CAMNT_0020094203 /DNA_START=69 /DNA_END=4685 /DNA_ORIENTATION=-